MKEETSWTSIDLYYRGFHIKKSVPATIKANALKKIIDIYEQKGFKPSWNEETNNKVAQTSDPIMEVTKNVNTSAPDEEPNWNCKQCGGETTYKQGKSKTGKFWKGLFCTNPKCKAVEWL